MLQATDYILSCMFVDVDILFNPPPKTLTIDAKDIKHRSGDKTCSQHLTRVTKKKKKEPQTASLSLQQSSNCQELIFHVQHLRIWIKSSPTSRIIEVYCVLSTTTVP